MCARDPMRSDKHESKRTVLSIANGDIVAIVIPGNVQVISWGAQSCSILGCPGIPKSNILLLPRCRHQPLLIFWMPAKIHDGIGVSSQVRFEKQLRQVKEKRP